MWLENGDIVRDNVGKILWAIMCGDIVGEILKYVAGSLVGV